MVDIQQAEKIIGNKFDMVLILAQRVREIGRKPEIDLKSPKPASIAINDIISGKVDRTYLNRVKSRIKKMR